MGGSHSSASRQVSPQSVVNLRIHSSQKEVRISSTRQNNNFYMKGIRNINNILDMFKNNRSHYYSHLKNMINQHDQDINKCILFINKIKEHRHSKIKEKQINKFKRLYFKRYGYQHNLNRQMQNFNNIDWDHTLSRHLMCHPVSPVLPLKPAVIQQFLPHPWPPHLLQGQTQHPPQHQGTHTSVPGIHVKPVITPTSGSSTCPTPPHTRTVIPSTKRPQLCHNPQIPPIHHSGRTSLFQTSNPRSRWTQGRC